MRWAPIICALAAAPPVACDSPSTTATAAEPAAGARPDDRWATARADMVRRQLKRRNIDDKKVLEAMGSVPRHRFVPEDVRSMAYDDQPLPIGYSVTISQPYIVALMTQLAEVEKGDRVLDVGTGSGYQAAVLAQMGAEVYGIEIIEPLAKQAKERLKELGYSNTHVRAGDGYRGWPEVAPFDAIILAAAPEHVPAPLKQQLKVGGKLVLPVGRQYRQELKVITRTRTGFREETVLPVAFVPMTGEAQNNDAN